MAAKHDGKHARANMWVTHQNLARAKGGRPPPQFKERKIPKVTAKKGTAPVVSDPSKPAEAEVLTPVTPASPETPASDE